MVEERGARFALLFLPRVNEIRRGRFMFDVSSFEYPDIRGHFPQDEKELARHRFPDDGHWNARGHRVAARAVVAALVDAGLIETRYLREPGADS